jgi:hypothetical protein
LEIKTSPSRPVLLTKTTEPSREWGRPYVWISLTSEWPTVKWIVLSTELFKGVGNFLYYVSDTEFRSVWGILIMLEHKWISALF